ncbi:MAG: sulfotransferase domain-containing protein [Cyanobacteria bacterium SBC]|nr:sulfotransferase domain-containing protein [Cyanobacteria bacterium SBC]
MSQGEGIIFEMKNRTKSTIQNMLAWDYSNPNVIEVRYEDLIKNEETEFKKIFLHYGLTEAQVLEALEIVRQCSFKKLAKRQSGQENRKSHFRKGISGDWENYFTSEHIQIFEELFPDALEKLGYSWKRSRSIQSYLKLGNQLQKQDKLEEAISAYRKAIEQNPTFYASYHNLGEVFTQ